MKMTREEWLKRGVRTLRPLLRKAGITMRARRQVSMSLASTRKAIGQCWYEAASKSGQTANILICPTLADPVDVLDVLLHEMIHAALPYGTHHGPKFVRACKHIGMTKNKPTSASACPELRAVLERVAAFLGPFPTMRWWSPAARRAARADTGLCSAPRLTSGYRVQISAKALEEFGPPTCPITGDPMVPATGKAPRW